jgi:predicted lactoylglutathione lyase
MSKMIFVNLPVENLEASIDFFTQLGYTFNPQFTDETATCMIISETIYAMLLTKPKFESFIDKPISNAKAATEVLISLNFESAEEVRQHCEKAFALGARNYKPAVDMGFMFQWGFEDLDGHIWEAFWMDPAAVQ